MKPLQGLVMHVIEHGATALPWSLGASAVQSFVPDMEYTSHKGQAGRIGVVGGSVEYTGAPYYAALSAMHVGADLSWVFTADEAATPIKCYSPDLIVIPSFKSSSSDEAVRDDLRATVEPWLDRLHGLVVGPGLGRREGVLAGAAEIIKLAARDRRMPVVVDADGLFLVSQRPELVSGCPNVVLTPNKVEFDRIRERVLKPDDKDPPPDAIREAKELVDVCRALGGVTIIRKGRRDLVSDGTVVLACVEPGCPRRCGGIGDVLAGSAGVLAIWASRLADADLAARGANDTEIAARPVVFAAYAATVLARRSARAAYAQKRRAMLASDVLSSVGGAFEGMLASSR